jgi:hypothetical protein
MSRRGSNPTVVFTTLRADIEPTAADVERLLPILQDIKAGQAADCFPMQIILHVKHENIGMVRGMIADLYEGGFISNLKAQQLRAKVKAFEGVVLR